jgi:photosystem II stability/assembly factor-like uncharacterized protein
VTPSIVYAGTTFGGVFKTDNGGENWRRINNGLNVNSGYFALAIDPTTPSTVYVGASQQDSGVFKSDDGGENWTAVNNGLMSRNILALAVDPLTSSTVYAATIDGVFQSDNAGESWTGIGIGLSVPDVTALAIDPAISTGLRGNQRPRRVSQRAWGRSIPFCTEVGAEPTFAPLAPRHV